LSGLLDSFSPHILDGKKSASFVVLWFLKLEQISEVINRDVLPHIYGLKLPFPPSVCLFIPEHELFVPTDLQRHCCALFS
jgi:hypothetical protein